MADKEEKAKDEEAEAPKKKSKLMLIVVLINLLGVGGMGAYLVFFQKPAAAAPAAEAAAAAPAGAGTSYGPLVELTPLVANLNDEHIGRYIRVTMHLEVADEEVKAEVEEALIPIRNRLVIFFSELTTEQANASGSRERIRGELVEAVNEVLGAPKVRRIFYTDFVVQ